PPSPLRAVEFVADPPLVERAPDAVEALTPLLLGSSAAIPPTLGGRTFLVQTCSVAVSPASADHAKFWLGVMRSPSGMSDGLACYSSSDSLSPPNRKPPTIVVGGSTVLFGWCGRWGRTGSVSDASWLGGRDDHLPAGATAL